MPLFKISFWIQLVQLSTAVLMVNSLERRLPPAHHLSWRIPTLKIVFLKRQELVARLARVTQDRRLRNLCPRIGVFGFQFHCSYSAWKTRPLACYAPARDRTTVHRGSSHLQSLSQVPETGNVALGCDECAADCGSPWCLKKGYQPIETPVGKILAELDPTLRPILEVTSGLVSPLPSNSSSTTSANALTRFIHCLHFQTYVIFRNSCLMMPKNVQEMVVDVRTTLRDVNHHGSLFVTEVASSLEIYMRWNGGC